MSHLYDTTIPNAIAMLPLELHSLLFLCITHKNSFIALYSDSILIVPT